MASNETTSQHTMRQGGIYTYLMTPFDAKGDVQLALLADYATAMIEAGVDGLTCIASTCEWPYLTEKERHLVASTVGRAAAGRVPVNIGIGAVSTRQAIEYAKQARDSGATSLMLDMQHTFPSALTKPIGIMRKSRTPCLWRFGCTTSPGPLASTLSRIRSRGWLPSHKSNP
jgi:hypothetical protein